MHVVVPETASTCRSNGAKGEWIEKVYDYVIAWNSPKEKISQSEAVEDFESRPHKAVSLWKEKRRCRNGTRKASRKKRKRKRQRRRGGRRGQWRKNCE